VIDSTHITLIGTSSTARNVLKNGAGAGRVALPAGIRSQAVRVELSPEVDVSMSTLERNFYTTSSCGVCTVTELAVTAVTAPHTGVTPAGKV
jgi:formate dehydrogenase assembly factor FdhD